MPETIGAIILSATGLAAIEIVPAGIGFAGITVGSSTAIASAVGYAVVLGVSLGVQALTAPTPTITPLEGQITTRQPTPARFRSYGRVKIAGPLVFEEVDDFGELSRVIAINQGTIDAIEEIWLADKIANVVPPGGFVMNLYGGDVGDPHVQIQFEFGSDDALVLSMIQAEFPTLWTADHRGRGVAKIGIKIRQTDAQDDFITMFPGGDAPAVRAVIRACKVWDPRNPAQERNSPTTWQWSDNPVLCALDFHRHADGMGLASFDHILFTDAALAEDWIPAANICDELVPLKEGGSEKRYRCSGTYSLPASAPKDVLNSILATCGGETYQRTDGAIGMRVRKVVDPAIIIDDRAVLRYADFMKGQRAFRACNQITAKFTSQPHDFQLVEAQAWRDEADIAARGEITQEINLAWCPSHSQARRLMKLAFHRFNPEWSGSIVTNLHGLLAYTERDVFARITELELEGSFEKTSFEMDTSTMMPTIGVATLEQAALDWNPASEQGDAPLVPPDWSP